MDLCDDAGFKGLVTKRELNTDFWNTVDATHDSVIGSYYCLKREEITPMENIPAEHKQGWNFALWYAFSRACSETSHSDYHSIHRETNLLATSGAAWGKNKQFVDYSRLLSLVRLLAQKLSNKVKNPRKFIKGEGYFLEKFCGKKPIGGLYTEDELQIVTQHWVNKQQEIKRRYASIPNQTELLSMGGLSTIIREMNISSDSVIKNIEDCVDLRIPMLLIVEGRGKSTKKVIVKGGNLPEKLIKCNGGLSVRTIGKVLWSPLIKGFTQNVFIDMCFSQARSLIERGKGKKGPDFLTSQLDSETDPEMKSLLAGASSSINQAASVYLEVYPEHTDKESWNAIFAV
jgi:hypothetical protein